MATSGQTDTVQESASDAVGGSLAAKCLPCKRTDVPKLATLFCNTCEVYLCHECCDTHKIHSPHDENHTIVAANEAISTRTTVDLKGLDKCLEHERAFMFQCEEHGDLCCELCVIAYHRKCDNVPELAELVKKKTDQILIKEVHATVSSASGFIETCEQDQLKSTGRMEQIGNEIEAFKEMFLKKFEEAKIHVLRQMTDHNLKVDSRIESRKLGVERAKTRLESLLEITDKVSHCGSEIEKFIINHTLANEHSSLSDTLRTFHANRNVIPVGLSMTENLSEILKSSTPLFSLVETNPPQPARLKLVISVKLGKTWNDTTEPYVSGLDFLPDGRIAAVDCYNLTCFIMSSTLKRLGRWHRFNACPKDVICYKDNDIAVTVSFDEIHNICLMAVGSDNTITLMKTLNVSFSCWSIALIKTDTFALSTWNNDPRQVRMIDVNGSESDFDDVEFPAKTYTCEDSTCTYNSYQDTLVFVDRNAHKIYIYNTTTGNSIEVTDKRIKEPRGVCVGPCGSMFICSEETNSVVQISPAGCVLASCNVNMDFPMTIAISRDGSRLAVSNSLQDGREIKLFKISSEM
ncbi:uncharacterized protein LOC128220295 [Mya arenaria]|uniref:uncharacterized protein LOC128220295 n=1 Tax=Mya arenaria TaxID=6604 RepID=UPI0022E919C6|nr:uncharacterized protein LOC128220295 [Mya arenaria]